MKTLVLGASTNPRRYSHTATRRLLDAGHEVVLVGGRAGELAGESIHAGPVETEGVDTVTLYVGPARQPAYYDYLLREVKPRRLIFNPGTENPELMRLAREAGVEVEVACTLVMLATGQYA